jgi:hypothetical protein
MGDTSGRRKDSRGVSERIGESVKVNGDPELVRESGDADHSTGE